MKVVAIRTYGQYLGILQRQNTPTLQEFKAKIELYDTVFSSKLVLDSDVKNDNAVLDQPARKTPNVKQNQRKPHQRLHNNQR